MIARAQGERQLRSSSAAKGWGEERNAALHSVHRYTQFMWTVPLKSPLHVLQMHLRNLKIVAQGGNEAHKFCGEQKQALISAPAFHAHALLRLQPASNASGGREPNPCRFHRAPGGVKPPRACRPACPPLPRPRSRPPSECHCRAARSSAPSPAVPSTPRAVRTWGLARCWPWFSNVTLGWKPIPNRGFKLKGKMFLLLHASLNNLISLNTHTRTHAHATKCKKTPWQDILFVYSPHLSLTASREDRQMFPR